MRSFIKFASLAVLALLLTLTLLGLMSATTTALTFADANPIGEEPLAYDGPLSTLAEGPYPSATEAEDLDPRADEPTDAAPRHSICRPGHRLCGFFRSLAEGPGTNAVPTENRTEPIQAPGGSPPTSPEAPIANT
ncbi:hypothetical protein BGZ88_003367 [Linnemannia elongata]|nr:hypothetical protein BGZ88_003367 [Linnemannia elongata]